MGRRKSQWAPGPVVWRVLFRRNGPTKKAMRKALAEWTGPRRVASVRRDEGTGNLKTKGLTRNRDGTFVYKPPKTRTKNVTAKQRTAEAITRNAAAARQHRAPRPQVPAAMTDRVIQGPDGRLNGSRKAATTPVPRQPAYRQAEAVFNRAMRAAADAEQRANESLGW